MMKKEQNPPLLIISSSIYYLELVGVSILIGHVVSWIRRLTLDQEIVTLSPVMVASLLIRVALQQHSAPITQRTTHQNNLHLLFHLKLTTVKVKVTPKIPRSRPGGAFPHLAERHHGH